MVWASFGWRRTRSQLFYLSCRGKWSQNVTQLCVTSHSFRSFFRTLAATQIASLQPNQISQPNNTNDFIWNKYEDSPWTFYSRHWSVLTGAQVSHKHDLLHEVLTGLVCRGPRPFVPQEVENMLAWIALHVPCHAKGNAWTSRTAPSLFRRMCSDVCAAFYSVTNNLNPP